MTKTILSVGYEIPGHSELAHKFNSKQSLLDADIVVFRPDIPNDFKYGSTQFQGHSCLDESSSFRLKEASAHWKADLLAVLNAGKTVFVIMGDYEQVYVHSGRHETSGTGRNANRTNFVDSYDNLRCMPVQLPKVIAKGGSTIVSKGHPAFASFQEGFAKHLFYKCYLDAPIGQVLFTTKVGEKPVGALIPAGKGHLVILPEITYDYDSFVSETDAGEVWTRKGVEFGKRLIKTLVDIDKTLKSSSEATPPPEWANGEAYILANEAALRSKISEANERAASVQNEIISLETKLEDEGLLRALTYEKGKRLEAAILRALRVLGYKAEEFDDGTTQLDQVILGPDGERFIGEAEGKDSSAINIEKFRQLATNIQEDLERDEVEAPAKGILFGNPHRLLAPNLRTDRFTTKCIANAERSGTALVFTPDLFAIARYVTETADEAFAKACRDTLMTGVGAVTFPEVPTTSDVETETVGT